MNNKIIPWKEATPSDTIIFMHIPKTAGTSTRLSLQSVYRDKYFNLTPMQDPWPDLSGCHNFQAFSGHILLDHPIYEKFDRFIHVAMLRNPVERVMSQYNYLRTAVIHPLHQFAIKTPLKEIFKTDRAGAEWGMSDLMVRHIGQGDLNQAKSNLTEIFSYFGLTERYDVFFNGLASKLSWFWESSRYDNISVYDNVFFDDSDIEMIVEHNQLDIELYEYAKSLKDSNVKLLKAKGKMKQF